MVLRSGVGLAGGLRSEGDQDDGGKGEGVDKLVWVSELAGPKTKEKGLFLRVKAFGLLRKFGGERFVDLEPRWHGGEKENAEGSVYGTGVRPRKGRAFPGPVRALVSRSRTPCVI